VRVGVAGLGRVVGELHLPALERLRAAELVGGADPSAEARERWRRKTGTDTFEKLAELQESARPELVIIAAPPASHADLAIAALRSGAHVLCEKPLAPTLKEAERILAAAEAAGRGVAVNHNLRTMPIFTAVREELESGRAGELVFAQAWQLVDLPPWRDPREWVASHPDRTLLEAGIHAIDLLLHLFGERPAAVSATQASGMGGPADADAISLVTLEFSGKRLAQLTSSTLSRSGARHLDLRADCEHASLRASIGGRALLKVGKKRAQRGGIRLELGPGGSAWRERGLERRTIARNRRHPARQATRLLLQGTINAFERGAEPPCSGGEARDALEVVEAAYRSARSGERVQLAPANRPATGAAASSS
jgi:predicted dehydrogenase